MRDVKTILCPTDFSECSQAAVQVARQLALRFGAKIELVHVFQLPSYVGWEDGPTALAASASYLDESRQLAAQKLAETSQELAAGGVTASTRQVDGLPHQFITELSQGADLVVMGTHGRTGLPHLMLGSVAERVVRSAHCPVLTVPLPAAK